MKNANLHRARAERNDEFYTQLTDVSKELMHYKKHFKDKIVLCNCDDPTWSAFWKYFHLNFAELGLKRLVSTHYEKSEYTFGKKKERSYVMVYEGGNDNDETVGIKTPLKGDGDFRSSECIEILKQCDIVVTNPPFSIAREYVACLMEYQKKFLIIGDMNWITYKEVFPLLKNNDVWLGYNSVKEFIQPDGSIKKFGNKLWFTNLDHKKRHEKLILWKNYTPEEYPTYDNYDAINVDKVDHIPCDYYEAIGVPITFIDKFNPEQFEVVGADFDLARPIKLDNGKTGTGRFYVTREREFAFILSDSDTQEEIKNILINDIGVHDDQIEYRKGIIGVPITFLDKYNPEQFEIVGLGTTRDLYTPTKTYINPKKYFKDGRVISANEINSTLAYPIKEEDVKNVYYKADNVSVLLFQPYARILIRKKVGA